MSLRLAESARPGAGERELAARSSATDWKWIGATRGDQSFLLESLQRRVNGANRVVAPRPVAEIRPDREAIGVVLEAGDGEQRSELQ